MALGPKGGRQLTGPVNSTHHEIHPCYSDFIIAGLAKVEYLARSNISERRRLGEWENDFPYRCRTSCPGADLDLIDMDRNLSTTPPSSPIIGPAPGPFQALRPRSSAPPVESSTSMPSGINLITIHQPPSSIPQTTAHPPPFLMPECPPVLIHSYASDTQPEFCDFESFEVHLQRDPLLIDDHFRVSGLTVHEAAQALILAIKSSHQNHWATFHPSTQVRSGNRLDLSLSNILLFRTWLFDA